MFQAVEKLNRRLTFMTALDLARNNPDAKYLNQIEEKFGIEIGMLKEKGYSHTEAVAFYAGKDAVESTQFNYSAWARPRVMRGRKSAFLTFFMFTQNMLWFIGNNPGNTRYLLMLLMFAGLKGMPGAEDLEALAKTVGTRISGKNWSPEKEFRKMILDHFPDGPSPDLYLHGISRYGFGLPHLGDMTGLPLPSVDLSGNLGMGSPLPIVSPLIQAGAAATMPGGAEFDEALGKFTHEGVGASLSIPLNILQASLDSRLPLADPKRWEKAMPASLSAASKALRFYAEGEERSRSGSQVLAFDRNNPAHVAELIAQAAGFYPTRRAEAWDRIIALSEAGRYWAGRRGTIFNQWDRAKMTSDPKDIDEMLKAVNRYNQNVPYPSLKITRKDLNRSYKLRQKNRKKQEALEPPTKYMKPVYEEIKKLYPGTTIEEDIPSGN